MKLSQSELARRIGASRSVVSLWENGVVRPSLASLDAWATTLGLQLTLVPLDDGKP